MIIYSVGSTKVNFDIGYSENNAVKPEFDFGLENVSTRLDIPIRNLDETNETNIQRIFNELCWVIDKQVVYRMLNNSEFMPSIHGTGAVWRPNRMSYGYTFKQNKGMIKKLVDYLDSGNTGTKLDFLTDIGILEKTESDGKPYYRKKGSVMYTVPSDFRGQHSGFFNSAKLAGILDYHKVGNQFLLKKGPNFEKFKSGELKAL